MITTDAKQLEVVVKQGHEDFDDISDNAGLYKKIDLLVRGDVPAIDMPRTKQQSVGGVVGKEFRRQAFFAIALSLIGIFFYITLRFESIFAIGAISALAHDTLIAVGIFVLLGNQISLPVIAAILTIIGYSLNDTIVVFDRIRENFRLMRRGSAEEIINNSINQMLGRTIITSMTTLLVLASLYFLGGESVSGFALALIVGVLVGTYSSIYIASASALALDVSPVDLLPPKREEIDSLP
jgi:preprotein translocase subunit SecF